jgi:hypothetical protein
MSSSLRIPILSGIIACAALLAIGIASATSAQAAPAAVKLPNPCKTFTAKSADALFAVKHGTHLSVKSAKVDGENECVVTHGKVKLTIGVSSGAGGFGGPLKCYKHKNLGNGVICVSTVKSFPLTLAIFHRYKIYFGDDYNRTLPKEGARLYAFALGQYKSVKR